MCAMLSLRALIEKSKDIFFLYGGVGEGMK